MAIKRSSPLLSKDAHKLLLWVARALGESISRLGNHCRLLGSAKDDIGKDDDQSDCDDCHVFITNDRVCDRNHNFLSVLVYFVTDVTP